MFKIMDLFTGKTVINNVDDDYINTTLPRVFETKTEHGIPAYCWLSLEAVANFDRADDIQKALATHVINNARFIDEDADNTPDTNETGCYFGFVQTKESARYHVRGTVRKGDVVLPSFLVKVSDQDVISDDLCGFAFTDYHGCVDVAFDREDFSKPIMGVDLEGVPELYVDVSELDIITGTFRPVTRHRLLGTQGSHFEFGIDLAR